MDKLFAKFERLHVEKYSSVQGTGLGLSITKDLIELMNGVIDVKSTYGKGTTFSASIPQVIGNSEELEKYRTERFMHINQLIDDAIRTICQREQITILFDQAQPLYMSAQCVELTSLVKIELGL